jgi:hypothetical protein
MAFQRLQSSLSKRTGFSSRMVNYWLASSFSIAIVFLYYLLLALWDDKLPFRRSQVIHIFQKLHQSGPLFIEIKTKRIHIAGRPDWGFIRRVVSMPEPDSRSLLDEIFHVARFRIWARTDAFLRLLRPNCLSDDDGSRLGERERRRRLPRSRSERQQLTSARMEASASTLRLLPSRIASPYKPGHVTAPGVQKLLQQDDDLPSRLGCSRSPSVRSNQVPRSVVILCGFPPTERPSRRGDLGVSSVSNRS